MLLKRLLLLLLLQLLLLLLRLRRVEAARLLPSASKARACRRWRAAVSAEIASRAVRRSSPGGHETLAPMSAMSTRSRRATRSSSLIVASTALVLCPERAAQGLGASAARAAYAAVPLLLGS